MRLTRELLKDRQELEDRIDKALDIAFKYAQIDGAHHKAWTIDQMVRALVGNKYNQWIEDYMDGKDGPETYIWDEGIIP